MNDGERKGGRVDSGQKNWWRNLLPGRPASPAVAALRTVLYYAITATVWILFSDQLVRSVTVDPNVFTALENVKGLFFVIVTSGLLFFQIRSDLAHLQESGDQLRESETRFRRVIEVSPVPMVVLAGDGRVTLVNAEFVKLLGYTPEEVPNIADWWPIAYPDEAYRSHVTGRWQKEIERARATKDAFVPVQARIRSKDGTERTMLVSSADLCSATSEQVIVFFDITGRVQAEAEVIRSNERLEEVLHSVTGLIGKVVEARDPYTQGHEEGVARISRLIADEMGLPTEEAEGIEVAALVHDVGKLSVPAEILTKPGKLTDLEFALIKGHSEQGHQILKDIAFDWPVAAAVLQHHERMDGSGYPGGLQGDEISMPARILMVADVIEAMGAHRPYRSALGLDAAMTEITSHPEKYDPQVIAACERLHAAGRITV